MANYLDHYGLEREPFGDRPGDVVLATKPVCAVLQRIRSDLAVGSTHICVYGEPGVGKSSLARSLPAVLRQSEAVAGVARIGNPKWDWEETRRSIGRQLGLGDGPLSRTRLMAACGHGRRLVLVVDSAHRLSYEILDHLEALLRTTTSLGEPLFACVMLADSGPEAGGPIRSLHAWLELLRTLPLELEPLSRAGLGGYVRRRLDYAGYRGDPIFSPTALDAVYGFTAGVPRAVNALCHLVLGEAYLRGETEVRASGGSAERNGARGGDDHRRV